MRTPAARTLFLFGLLGIALGLVCRVAARAEPLAFMRLVFEGRVQVVDVPGGAALVLLAMLLGVATRRGRAGLRSLPPCARPARPACVKAT
jgi:hypothetical protein